MLWCAHSYGIMLQLSRTHIAMNEYIELDWGKITKVHRLNSELMLHLDGHTYVGKFYYFTFTFQRDPRFIVKVSEKTTAFEVYPSKN